MHEGHKLYEINDQDSLKKENITINSSSNDFKDIISNLNNLKDKIEKEIINIDEAFNKVFDEVGKFYEKKREILNAEEKNMKEKLQNEVTKTKEKMEIHLSESNRLIRENERILKGLNSLKKEDENIIKILSYVSKINKNKKSLNQFFLEKMKNLKISFNALENNIIYEEYYFNSPILIKNIKIENINFDNFDVSWEIEGLNINNDNNNFNHIIEIREENTDGKFKKIYEGNKTNFNINKLKDNSFYEIRICTIYKEITNPWSEIKKIKTLDWKYYCDSKILEESNQKYVFFKLLKDWTKSNKLELLYRGSRDGSNSKDFHSKCDNKGATLCLYKNDKNFIFGGYNPISWDVKGGWIKNDESFLFTLTNVHNTEPNKFPHKNGEDSFFNEESYGPTFDDIYIENYQNSKAILYFPRGHIDNLNLGKSIFSGEKDNNIDKTQIIEIEVFKVIK